MECEMCGGKPPLFRTEIEGTILSVCRFCAKHGTVIQRVRDPAFKPAFPASSRVSEPKKEVVIIIADGYDRLIRESREKMGLTQKELAKKLNEKESLIHKMESGHFEPSVALAKKIENFFGIKLVDQYAEEKIGSSQAKPDSFTIGDFIKVRKR